MNKKNILLTGTALSLAAAAGAAHAAPAFDQWTGTGPFATGDGNRAITALAVSADGAKAYAGTRSGTVWTYAFADVTPDAFSFAPQLDVAPGTVVTSNPIVVSGINTAAAVSVTGGTYSINGGAYTAAAGSVHSGDTVTLRQTSSAAFSSTTIATLTIGGMGANFQATTQAPVTTYTAPAGPGTGNVTAHFTGGGSQCSLATSAYAPAANPPSGISLPYGVFSFSTTRCDDGATLSFTITYPHALPAQAKYYKFGPEFGGNATPHWYELPGAVIHGNQVTFSITDNGVGDSNPALGYITDPGGVGMPMGSVASVPTLSEWTLALLTVLTGLMGLGATMRRGTRGFGTRHGWTGGDGLDHPQ